MVNKEILRQAEEAEEGHERIPISDLTQGLKISLKPQNVKVAQSIHYAASKKCSTQFSPNSNSKSNRKAAS